MEIDLFSNDELPIVFRVLRRALNPGPLQPIEAKFLKTYAYIMKADLPLNLALISPSEITMPNPHKAKRLVQLASLAVLLSNPLRLESVEFVESVAKKLKVNEPVIPVLHAVQQGQKLKARLLTARRGARMILGEAYRREGPMGVARFFGALIWRVSVNKDKLGRYLALEKLPEGTLGREYFKHIRAEGFNFPGEPGGIPEAVSYHDVSHVLNDNDTTPLGEIQQGSFQAGSRREGGFGFVQFVVLQFHHGIKITPVAPGEVGNFDPEKVLWAIYRGSKFKADVTQGWDYWPLMPLPMAEARAKCGLLPKLS